MRILLVRMLGRGRAELGGRVARDLATCRLEEFGSLGVGKLGRVELGLGDLQTWDVS